jgi:hypothetical protein
MDLGTKASLEFVDKNWILHMDHGDSRFCTKSRRGKVSIFSTQH